MVRSRLALCLLPLAVLLAFSTIHFWVPALLFRPTALSRLDPVALGVPDAATVTVRYRDGAAMVGLWRAPAQSNGPVALIVHGRSANIVTRIGIMRRLAAQGVGVLLFDYRGYGASSGRPSEQGWLDDTFSAYRWLRRQGVAATQILVIGQSLGNSAAARLAAARPVGGLVLVAPFTNLPDALAERLPWLPVRLVPWRRNRFEVDIALRRFQGPTLLVASAADDIVPIANARRLRGGTRKLRWLDATPSPHEGMLRRIADDGRLAREIWALHDPTMADQ